MLKLCMAILVLLNLAALFFCVAPFFFTFADLPVAGVPMVHTPDELAIAIGHARVDGIEVMRRVLLPPMCVLVGVMLVNLAAALIALSMYRAPQPDTSLQAPRP